MFKSLTYKTYDPNTDKYIYDLEDTDFGVVEGEVGVEVGGEVGVMIAREYSKRNLDVGKNLAIYTLWFSEKYRFNILESCKRQNEYCPKYIKNWKSYASSRDEWLEKLLLIH